MVIIGHSLYSGRDYRATYSESQEVVDMAQSGPFLQGLVDRGILPVAGYQLEDDARKAEKGRLESDGVEGGQAAGVKPTAGRRAAARFHLVQDTWYEGSDW